MSSSVVPTTNATDNNGEQQKTPPVNSIQSFKHAFSTGVADNFGSNFNYGENLFNQYQNFGTTGRCWI